MQAEFHLRREQQNKLEYGQSTHVNRSVHFHSQIEIYLVIEGEIEVWINDKHRVLHAGEIAVALSYDTHGYRTVTGSSSAYLIVPTDLLHDFLPMFSERRVGDPFISDPEVFEKVYAALREILAGAGELATRGYIYVILGTLWERLSPEMRSEPRDPQLFAKILLYINEHFREELTLTTLAAAFGYNSSYLSRSFRETFGITFSRYVTMVRLREAIRLLRADGSRSIVASAMESGFGSLRSFYRAFTEEFGCTPRAYLDAERG